MKYNDFKAKHPNTKIDEEMFVKILDLKKCIDDNRFNEGLMFMQDVGLISWDEIYTIRE